MSSSGLCKRVEKGMTELLDEGRTVVKTGEIAERWDIEKETGTVLVGELDILLSSASVVTLIK